MLALSYTAHSIRLHSFIASVDLREIREVRRDCGAREFKSCAEELKKMEPVHGFAIFYGSEFNLKTLALVGKHVCVGGTLRVLVVGATTDSVLITLIIKRTNAVFQEAENDRIPGTVANAVKSTLINECPKLVEYKQVIYVFYCGTP